MTAPAPSLTADLKLVAARLRHGLGNVLMSTIRQPPDDPLRELWACLDDLDQLLPSQEKTSCDT
jgi:hypothetical protein